MKHIFRRRSGARALTGAVLAVATAILIAACGSSGSSSGSGSGGSTNSSSSGGSSGGSGQSVKIAYLSFAVQNSYDAPMLAAAKKVAASENATLQVFDANNSPTKQYAQFQDAITQGGFKGIIMVNIDQILGPSLSTSAVQVSGLSGNVTFNPTEMGQKLGKLVVQACASKHLSPCNVGYLFDIKASALDVAINKGFQQATAGTPVKVVAQGQDFFLPADGLSAVQTMLNSNPSINVIAGSDQGIEGAQRATGGKNILLVGYGGSAAGIAGVKSGAWYGTISQDPASEGKVGMQQLISAIRTGKKYSGDNPLNSLPAGGVITKGNAHLFTGEWPG